MIRALDNSDLPAVRALLAAEQLPIDDLEDPAIALFGAFEDSSLAGVIGLQACGDAGLLRSLAVAPPHRGRGVAERLCTHVFQQAKSRSLWLLTTSAKDYFVRHGFEVVAREQAPDAIRATAQFASLCPATAHVMRRGQAGDWL